LEVLAGQPRNAFGVVTGERYYAVERRPLATEDSVAEVVPGITEDGDQIVGVEFEPAAAASLGDATERSIGHNLAVVVDGRVVSAPRVEGRLGERVVVRGGFTIDEIQELSALLSGALPPGAKVVAKRVVGAARD
jgi:preprotein translocase subunit SecD